ncbi:hypothetical protein GCM10010401_19520 [Rarobacter faecitabidus]|uniref:hypothetical protein n=1 Tax=Rarobacter faecitabidus TaxID=13243 RepID=UPI001476A204|nr:hypothetical protein [Rarobacter faecitabidus]
MSHARPVDPVAVPVTKAYSAQCGASPLAKMVELTDARGMNQSSMFDVSGTSLAASLGGRAIPWILA